MAETFDCPKCGAPVKYSSAEQGDVEMITCPYCGESIVIPEAMYHHKAPASQPNDVHERDRSQLAALNREDKAYPAQSAPYVQPYQGKDANAAFNAWFKWVFIGIGMVCLALGVKSFFTEKALIASYTPATARLSELQLDSASKYHPPLSYCPRYAFTMTSGKLRSFTNEQCTQNPDLRAYGVQQMQVYYNPENADVPVETSGWLGSEYSGLLTGIIGFVFFGFIWAIWAVSEWAGARGKRHYKAARG